MVVGAMPTQATLPADAVGHFFFYIFRYNVGGGGDGGGSWLAQDGGERRHSDVGGEGGATGFVCAR